MTGKQWFQPKKWWLHYIWPVARHLIIPLLCALMLVVGLAIGYCYLGGYPFSDLLHRETWRHLYDLVFSDA